MKRVTLDDIAKKTNVTKVTVSKVLNNKPGISDPVRQAVLETAKELGYKKLDGKLTVSQKVVACLVTPEIITPHEAFYTVILNHIIRHSKEFDMIVVPYILNKNEIENIIEPNILSEVDIEGILVLGQIEESYLEGLLKKEIPICLVDFYDNNLELDNVTTDNIDATYKAINEIIKKDNSLNRFCFVGDLNTTSSLDRYLGFKRALLEHKILVDKRIVFFNEINLDDLKIDGELVDCLVCINDFIAFQLIHILEDLGLSVPSDIRILGFDNTLHSELSNPKISTINVDKEKMAISSLQLLLNRINNNNLIVQSQKISSKLIIRESLI